MSAAGAPGTAPVTGWDRAVVIALGGAGCALSYDALQQMAVAIHVRGPLTYLFPLVIDGFIAYGIRALLVLRTAPLRSRLYVWMLFGTATAASIWANALHAVRLNQQAPVTEGLRLSDTVVAVLSTIAPLALAGAVHLYILIARGPVKDSDRRSARGSDRSDLAQAGHPGQPGQPGPVPVTDPDRAGQRQPQPGPVSAGRPVTDPRSLTGGGLPAAGDRPVSARPSQPEKAADLPGQPDTGLPVSDRDAPAAGDRRGDLDTEELLEIARSAVRAEDKLTRKVVAQAIRGQQIPLSSDTLTALMAQLREQRDEPVTTSRD
jgi:hypothetical protein